ncbi:MAG: ABC transporter ATP-binding protein [Proteobacteria bacterium]|nr:ABC transporter ATP-binding protein [Pseudomonadota bacterium]
MIQLHDLTKVFKTRNQKTLAVDGLSFEVKQGEIFGLLGPNGAGKTTTIRMLSTLVTPTSGDALINGWSILTAPENVRASIGISLSDERSFYYRLSGYQNLEFFGTLQNIPRRQLHARIIAMLEKMGLIEAKDTKFMKYSTGMKRKLSRCRALLVDPPVYFFDEPTTALDPPSAIETRETILDLKRTGKTILLTTQNMHEAEQLCDRIAIINKGSLVVVDTAQDLKRKLKTCTVQLVISDSSLLPLEMFQSQSYVDQISLSDGVCTIVTTDKMKLLDMLLSEKEGIRPILHDIRITEVSLEDVFLRYVKGERV